MAFRLPSFLSPRLRWRSGTGDPVLGLTAEGLVIAATPAAIAAIGAEGGLIGRSLLDFAAREDRAALKAAFARALANPPGSGAERAMLRLLRPGRSPIFVEIALQSQGRDIAALIRDRTAELAANRDADMMVTVAANTAAQPVENIEAVSADTGSISPDRLADLGHELKTPLNAIMGFAETMREETFGPLGHEKYREYADHIHAAGGHLTDLIAAILDRAKLDAGRYKLSPALAAPGPLAKSCAEMVRSEAEKAGLTLQVDIADDLPETMLDARAVKQILINLLTNAVKFTADGEIGLRVSEHDGIIEFAVADTGVGMSQMALARIGERFTDMHKNGVRGASGTGLGLSLAYALAKLHGGVLNLTSAPGEGTIATLSLPAARSLADLANAGLTAHGADIQSQLDRVAQYRRERLGRNAA